ncbi:hypothetical protein [Planctomycetes bacterium K23_9]|uniref:Large cysteine-rich periplasmic protein OmcB n=1 Tax=Stieleria marina TaxID=1930275 RepID=A0A517NWX7_9BACT|nr:hypothetical protein K239x_36350 [Planctomycetes bacterium K23_9]
MIQTVSRTNDSLAKNAAQPLRRVSWWCMVAALFLTVSSGCTRLRLPAIDPTGQRIFSPLPTTTGIALPGSGGEGGLLSRIKNGIHGPGTIGSGFQWPTPAFSDPAAPPECLTPTTPLVAAPAVIDNSNEPCVPSVPCTEDCKNGPPAVLLGRECNMRDLLTLPDRGKRGCILLTPQRIVAPVGGEVVLLSGLCGDDGYLQVGEPLEWMLTPDSVGTFLQVGDDDPGLLHRLARMKKAIKHDPSYAHGVTSTKRTLITRGNLDPRDDVQLEKGQTWITLSSPSEGTSRVTVLAPESDCWDNRKATATIYWIDARWVYPSSQIAAAGTPVQLSTRVTRSEGALPARGWKVRYTIMEPGLATFDGTNGSSVVEAEVTEAGNAVATLIPTPGQSGTAAVGIEIIRPGGVSDNIPDLTLSRGQTFVTWNAPQLTIKAGAPEIASFNQPVKVFANVANPGNQAVENVTVTMRIPEGVIARSEDGFAQNVPSAITWNIGTLPPQQQLDLVVDLTAQAPIVLSFEARGDGLVAEDQVQIDVYRPSLILEIQPDKERYETGEKVTFNVNIKNTGDRPINDLELEARGDGELVHEELGKAAVRKPKLDGPLQPGQTWPVAVVFVPTDSGRRCVNVIATGSGGQRAQSERCVTVINPVPATPALTAKLDRRPAIEVSETPTFIRGRVTNTGQVPLTNVRVTMTHDPQLQLLGATNEGLDRSRLGQYLVAWNLPRLEPGDSRLLEMKVRALDTNARSQVIMTTRTAEGAATEDSINFQIVPGLTPRFGPGQGGTSGDDLRAPDLPPVTASPSIPDGPAPIPGPGTSGNLPAGPTGPSTNTQRSNQLRLSLATRDNPVAVNQPIRYTLRVENDTDAIDSQVALRFELPPGVKMERVVQRRSPELGEYRNLAGIVELADIRTMRPGEIIDYELVLSSNQPQNFELVVEGASRLTRNIARTSAQTTVVP